MGNSYAGGCGCLTFRAFGAHHNFYIPASIPCAAFKEAAFAE